MLDRNGFLKSGWVLHKKQHSYSVSEKPMFLIMDKVRSLEKVSYEHK